MILDSGLPLGILVEKAVERADLRKISMQKWLHKQDYQAPNARECSNGGEHGGPRKKNGPPAHPEVCPSDVHQGKGGF